MDETKGGKGFFRQILAAATLLLYFTRQTCSVAVPPGLSLQAVTDANCPNETYHKCLPYGDCYSFDKYCDSQTRSVQSCFPESISGDKARILAWCLELRKGTVQLLDGACRFACEFTLGPLAELLIERVSGPEETPLVTVDPLPCQCDACRSSCDYDSKRQSQRECSTPATVVNNACSCGETNWDHRYDWIIAILVTLLCVSVGMNLVSCYWNWKLCKRQRDEKYEAILAHSDGSLESDQTGDENHDNLTSVVTLRRLNSTESSFTCSCNPFSACRCRVLE